MKYFLIYFFALIMLGGAAYHLIAPEFYDSITPNFVELQLANITAFIVEAFVGILLLIPRTRRFGAICFTLLMLAFLPIHIWDLTRDEPAVGSTTNAWIRLAIQFLLIAGGYWFVKRLKKSA